MAIQVSTEQVKAAVKAIRKTYATGNVPKLSETLEVASQALGYPTWDAMSAASSETPVLVKVKESREFELFAFLECYSDGDPQPVSPRWLKVRITGELLASLERMSMLAKEGELSEARRFYYDFLLSPQARCAQAELVVSAGGAMGPWFQIRARASVEGDPFGTACVDVLALQKAVALWLTEERPYPMAFSEDPLPLGFVSALQEQRLLPGHLDAEHFAVVL